ncbi:MAG: type I pullulanase [Lachnospiraceae bacterium]|nr:type I pullulanase [Lachnospiraceae bacterium]
MDGNVFVTKEFEEKYTYEGKDLGAVYSKENTTFKVWAPTASSVSVCLYTKGSSAETGDKFINEYEMTLGDKGVYTKVVDGDLDGVYYIYKVTVDGVTRETCDVYAKASGVNSLRSMVIDLSRTNPEGWENDKHITFPLEETEIWEVHVGDFSNDISSGIKPEHRGKFLAFTDDTSTLNGDGVHPTCVNYLKQLGITHVHLLPSYDYGSIDETKENENINWGYDPVNYNVPEGSYSTNPFDGAVRIKEFKEMVMALHKAGISVVMDVVYNHTYSLDSVFEKTVPGYYYRQDENGKYTDGSACGNDTASDREMYRRYMIDSVMYWANEYHIDGFRFDLMGLHDVETMNQIREAVNTIPECGKEMIIYGEPWSAGPSGFREGATPATKKAINELAEGIAVFNDDIRDAVKGPFCDLEVPGYVNGKEDMENDVMQVIPAGFAEDFGVQPSNPSKVINYVSAHDNSTLWDKLIDSVLMDDSYTVRNERLVKMNKLAATIVQFAKGIPFMQAGEEGARTKFGEDNSYNMSKKINNIDWARMYEYEDMIDYYKGLIAIRKEYPQIKSLTSESLDDIIFNETGIPGVVAFENGDLTFIYNASDKDVSADMHIHGKYLIDSGNIDLSASKDVEDIITVKSISATVILS